MAKIYTPFTGKFGIPRQSGLADVEGRVVLEPPYRSPDALRGIEGFSHLWLIWEFTEAAPRENALTVRPPRLGGNERVGVFASRSPYRPNRLGLSCVELIKIDAACAEAPVLIVRGADILSGTPVYDIKPYLPFADCVPAAVGGFAAAVAGDKLSVAYAADVSAVPQKTLSALTEVLRGDPRPQYQDDPARIYAFEMDGWHVEFRCEGGALTVTKLFRVQSPEF